MTRFMAPMTRREKAERVKQDAHAHAERLRVERASAAIRMAFEAKRAKAEGRVRPIDELPEVWDGRF